MLYPNLEASTNAKKLPPKEIQYGIVTPSISTERLSLYKKAGTFVKVTSTAFPFSTFTFVRIIPAGAFQYYLYMVRLQEQDLFQRQLLQNR